MTQSEKHKWNEIVELVGDNKLEISRQFVRWKCLTDLYYLATDVLGWDKTREGKRRIDPKFHKWLVGQLNRSEDKMILVARDHMKSSWVKLKIVQTVLGNPNVRILLASATKRLVVQELNDIKRIFATKVLRSLFPDIVPDPGTDYNGWEKCTEQELTLRRDPERGYVPQGPQILAVGVGAKITGFHFEHAFLDDVLDEKSVTTADQIEKTIDWWGYLQPMLDTEADITIIGTPYHYADLYAVIERERLIKHIIKRPAIQNGKPVYKYFTKKALDRRKRMMRDDYKFSCNPGYAPVWMSDLSFKPIANVEIGDEVVGYELKRSKGKRRRLIKTKVVGKGSRIAKTVLIQMESGRLIVCTPDHAWFTGRPDIHHKPYLPARVGRELFHMIEPTDESQISSIVLRDYSYLAGIFDGEGHVQDGNLFITQSYEHNPEVCEKIEDTFGFLGIKYTTYRDEREGKGDARQYYLNGGRQTKVNLLNYGKPAKAQQMIDGFWAKPGMKSTKDRIVSITPYQEETVYSLQTESGNYIVWGYASKNCQYLLNPTPIEEKIFPPPHPTIGGLPPDEYIYYIACDPAATTKTWSDHSGIVVGALCPEKRLYIVEATKVKLSGDKLADLLIQKVIQYNPRRVGIELGQQEHLKYIIGLKVNEYNRINRSTLQFPILPVKTPRNKTKAQKIADTFGSFCRAGRCRILDNCVYLLQQMDLYTGREADEDDLLDAASMLFDCIEQFAVHRGIEIPKEDPNTIMGMFTPDRPSYMDKFVQ